MKRTLFFFGLMLFVSIGTAMAQRGNGRTSAPTTTVTRTTQRPPVIAPTRQIPGQVQRNPEIREVSQVAANPTNNIRKIKLPKDLDLNDLQKRQIKHIFKEARKNGTEKRQVYHQVLRVLTPEQEEKYKERIDNLFGIGGRN
jgi:hypothetical protein